MFQVNINWEDYLQEEHNKGIFDMELEDVEENAESVAGVGTKVFWLHGYIHRHAHPWAAHVQAEMHTMHKQKIIDIH